MVINELMAWGCAHLSEDTSGNSRALLNYNLENFSSEKDQSQLLTIIGNLKKQNFE